MLGTHLHQSKATARDPVCGMMIDPDLAFATRRPGEETLYFCSQNCVQQFDREHAVSATTGVSEAGRLRWIDLPIAGKHDRQGGLYLEEHLKGLSGVQSVTANMTSNMVHIDFDPAQTQVKTLVDRIHAAGYTVGVSSLQLDIQGMHCGSCVVAIENALEHTPGVLDATVNLATQQASLEYLPGRFDRRGVVHAIEAAGYQVRTASLQVIVFSSPPCYPGLRDWLTPGSDARRLVWGVLALLTLPVLFWAGSHFYTGMWQALKHRQANMHTLISIGVSAAWLYSTVAVVAPQVF